MPFFAKSLAKIKPSPTIAMSTLAGELKAQGRDIISLSAGEPDFDTPDHVKEAAARAMADGKTKYTAVDGIPELKQAIVDKFKRENNITTQTSEVTVGTGGKQILYNALMATVNPGDEVIYPSPGFPIYESFIRYVQAVPVPLHLDESAGFTMTINSYT